MRVENSIPNYFWLWQFLGGVFEGLPLEGGHSPAGPVGGDGDDLVNQNAVPQGAAGGGRPEPPGARRLPPGHLPAFSP